MASNKKARALIAAYKDVEDFTSDDAMELVEEMIENDIEIDLIFDESGGNIRFTFNDETEGRAHFDEIHPEWIEKMHNAGVCVYGKGYDD